MRDISFKPAVRSISNDVAMRDLRRITEPYKDAQNKFLWSTRLALHVPSSA